MKKPLFIITLFAICANAAQLVVPYEHLTSSYTCRYGDTVILQKLMYIDSGFTLAADSGVLFKAQIGAGLVVAKGAKLVLRGTVTKPVIFTAVSDSMKPVPNITQIPNTGLWNGITILGRARVNSDDPVYYALDTSYFQTGTGKKEVTVYGGTDDNDSSGILSYVSIRYAGTNIYNNESNPLVPKWDDKAEFNALALCGVGSRTVIEYVEAYSGWDDGFKFLGGSVNCRYLVTSFADDDMFDFDEGYRGRNQYLFGLARAVSLLDNDNPSLIKIDDSDEKKDSTAIPTFANVTMMVTSAYKGFLATVPFKCINSILLNSKPCDFPNSNKYYVASNIFVSGTFQDVSWNDFANGEQLQTYMINHQNDIKGAPKGTAHAFFMGQSFQQASSKTLDPRPWDSLAIKYIESIDSLKDTTKFFKKTIFRGAFNPFKVGLWINGWTALDRHGYLPTTIDTVRSEYRCNTTGNLAHSDSQIPETCTTYVAPILSSERGLRVSATIKGQFLVIAPDQSASVTADIFEINGQRIRSLWFDKAASGSLEIPMANLRLSRGLYLCKVTAAGRTVTIPITVVR